MGYSQVDIFRRNNCRHGFMGYTSHMIVHVNYYYYIE